MKKPDDKYDLTPKPLWPLFLLWLAAAVALGWGVNMALENYKKEMDKLIRIPEPPPSSPQSLPDTVRS